MTMALNEPLCYYTIINKRRNMDYENDYDLLQDVHEQTMWEDSIESYMEDESEDDSEYYDENGKLIPLED